MEDLKRRIKTMDRYHDLLNKRRKIEKEIENGTATKTSVDYMKQAKDDLARCNMNVLLHDFFKCTGKLVSIFTESGRVLTFEEYTQRFYLNDLCQKMLDEKIIKFDFEQKKVIVNAFSFYVKHLLSMYLIDDLVLLVLSF